MGIDSCIRHNAKVLLPQVRGMTKSERLSFYAVCKWGALFPVGLFLASCQSPEDRYWSDMQTIIEHTQPRK